MGMGPSLGASTYSSSNLSSLLDSLKLKEPYKTEALFSSISSGALGPEVVDRYSPHAAFFLGIHGVEQKHFESAEILLRYAAEKDGNELQSYAAEEYLKLLSSLEKWGKLISFFEGHAVNRKIQPEAAVLYLTGLLKDGKHRTFSRAVEEYRELILNKDDSELSARYVYLQIVHERRSGKKEWRPRLIELLSRFNRQDLPPELFEDGDYMNILDLSEGDFPPLERSLLRAKYAYGRRDYHTAFSHYIDFIGLVFDDFTRNSSKAKKLELITGALTDEFALSGLYSGRTWEANAAVEKARRRLEEAVEDNEIADKLFSGDIPGNIAPGDLPHPVGPALFWILETEGYLSRKLGRFTHAGDLYDRALDISPQVEARRISWYRFDCLFRADISTAVSQLPELSREWSDPSYYTDVLYNLIDRLISRRQWKEVSRIADALEHTAVGVAGARAAYISARAAESGYINADEEQIIQWLRSAVRSSWGTGAGLYYRLMAATALEGYGISVDVMQPEKFCRILLGDTLEDIKEAERSLGATRTWDDGTFTSVDDVLIGGYVKFGLAAEAYQRYGIDRGYVDSLQISTLREWTAALQAQDMYLESIRMFSRYCRDTRADMNQEDVQLLYPDAYDHFIGPLTEEYELASYLFYALVREESLFDAHISSAAGAVGLSQLMPSTAKDVAGRIGVEIGELTDPYLNLRIGSWYLMHLMERTENISQALFAYNGGITRVRRWVRNAGGVEGDLVLELIPYQETSHYGRKVLVSSVLYGYFYEGVEPNNLIKSFFGL